jgi:glutamate synthase domain-containing protein 2
VDFFCSKNISEGGVDMGNLSRPNSNDATGTANRSRSVVPMSGICSRCVDGCTGNCEVFKATFRGRELLYPGPYGDVTAGADKEYPVDYSHLNIQGYALGAKGLGGGIVAGPDTATFPTASTETEYGWEKKVKMRLPVFTGALGSTEIARKNWEHFAVGAALSGVTIVCGENVCGIDPELELDNNRKVAKAPDMDRRIEIYRRYHQGYGEILVQLNVEDTRLGVAEYVNKKVTPDPSDKTIQTTFKGGALKEFERHSRMGFISEEGFLAEVQRLREIGFNRITLKTGAYSLRELAMAIRWGSRANIDLLTIDGSGGGTGMSPWRMMEEWGIPSIYLHSAAYEFCKKLADRGERVPHIAFAGGFSSEDGIFKGLALGSPFVKAICMGRALMIPGMVGKNIAQWLKEGKLPKTVSRFGSAVEEIFVNYEAVKEIVGPDEIKNIPLGAIGLYSYCDKIRVGLQQLMAGTRNFSLSTVSREDVMSLTEECAKVTGIPYLMEAYREEAEAILNS